MPAITSGARFIKTMRSLAAFEPLLAKRVRAAVMRFQSDPGHPGLNFEKLRGAPYHTIRATQGHRVILRQTEPDVFELIDIVDHDTMERRYGR